MDTIFSIHYAKNDLYWRKSFSEEKFSNLKDALQTINATTSDDAQIFEPIKAPSFL